MKPAFDTWLTHHKNQLLVAVIVAVVLVLSYVRSTARAKRTEAMAVAQSVRLYEEATTAAESSLVDVAHPIQGLTEETTCLALRREGKLSR